MTAARRRAFAVVAAMLAPWAGAAAADPLPFEGSWVKRGDTCAAGHPGTLVLTAKHLGAPTVMNCDFTSVLPGGISFRVEAECETADGHKGHEFFTFAVLAGLLHWGWGDRVVSLDPCRN